MKWQKPSKELTAFLKTRLKNIECASRKTFGCPSYFINNNMFTGVFGKSVFIRLAPEDLEKALKEYPEVRHFEPRKGMVMKEYVSLPESMHQQKNIFTSLLKKSLKYVRALPPKKKH